jgi:hypothetical protein
MPDSRRRLRLQTHRVFAAFCSIALAVSLLAPSASAELVAWDRTRVAGLAKDLAAATESLYEAFMQQQPPQPGSADGASYYKLRHRVRVLRVEAGMLVRSLEEGDGREQTEWIYDNLMSHARSARLEARGALVPEQVAERAAAVRGVLNQLGPYFDPDFRTLAPDPKLEPGRDR